MAKLININFFEGDLYIPQKSEPSVTAMLNRYIDKYEQEYFQKVLGYDLAEDFYGGLPAPAAPLDKLLTGELFDGIKGKEKWNGFLPSANISPCANYIWCKYMERQMVTQSTGAGEKVIEMQNAMDANPIEKLVANWNDMVNQHLVLARYFLANAITFPKFNAYYVNRSIYGRKNSLGI